MFPFVFKLWRYHGLPTTGGIPDISKVAPASALAPVASAREAEMDEIYARAQLQKTWQERYLPRLWGSGHPHAGLEPRVILAVDDGTPSFEGALKSAAFLAREWKASLAESPVMTSSEDVFRIAQSEGADWLVIGGKGLAESLVRETRIPILVDRDGSLAGGVRRILIPVDGTPESLRTIAEGLRWAHAFASELMVLHVAESGAEKETEHAAFLDILEKIRWEKVAHEMLTGRGTVADAISAAATGGSADLILMTTKRALIAVEVMQRTSAPVFVLRPEED